MKEPDVDARFAYCAVYGLGCSVAVFLLALATIVLVGCPAAVSYGAARGCAAEPERAR